jgi:hypothetical protein
MHFVVYIIMGHQSMVMNHIKFFQSEEVVGYL